MKAKGHFMTEMAFVVSLVTVAAICSLYFITGSIHNMLMDIASELNIAMPSERVGMPETASTTNAFIHFCDCQEDNNEEMVEVSGSTQG